MILRILILSLSVHSWIQFSRANAVNDNNIIKPTSLLCAGKNNEDRLCRVKNLCYYPPTREFVNVIDDQDINFQRFSSTSFSDSEPARYSDFNDNIHNHNYDDRKKQPDGLHLKPFIDIAAVLDHTLPHVTLTDLTLSSLKKFTNIKRVNGTSLLFKRFNPGNVMHVLHDDAMPLFVTMQFMGGITSDNDYIDRSIRIVYFDGVPAGPHMDLYQMLSKKVI